MIENKDYNNKRIAKNTALLYFRMLLIMGVSLYTSRIILDKLGVDDYALYNVVGGVVGMLSFLNGTLSNGTSRFLTFELGRRDQKRLEQTFSTAFYTHLILAIIILVIMETGGLWFLYYKLNIPIERITACLWVFQLSILTTFIAITQVPYTAIIMAHERMGIYAYVSIFEAFAKLAVCYLIGITKTDKLIVYAILLTFIQLTVALFYRIYCIKNFSESKISKTFEKGIFRNMMGFSGWNLMANLAETLKLQGYLILLNMFFQPAIVAAQSIGNQVANAMMQFINNFRTAINPQIIKLYAAEDYEASKRLTLSTTVLVFDLVLLLGLPTILVLEQIMDIWLVEVPPYAVIFTQYIIVQRILSTFDASFYIPMMAANKIKTNSILATFSGPGMFIILYLIYKLGGNVMWMQYIGIFVLSVFGFVIKPYLLKNDVIGYCYKDFLICFWNCLKVAILSILLSIGAYEIFYENNLSSSILIFIISAISILLSSYLFMDKILKEKVQVMIREKIRRYR